jgi:SAM-dependent methyltransferase
VVEAAAAYDGRRTEVTAADIVGHKDELRVFLARNPYPGRYTDGLFFRDKMRAIHRIAPQQVAGRILEVGGGRSGLTKLLYPDGDLTTVDLDPEHATADANRAGGVRFIQADATALPFPDNSFALVTMFDLLEHVDDDAAAAREAWRVLRPGGSILVTTPHRLRWRYPYYRLMRSLGRPEADLLAEWGHVRRGYTVPELEALFGHPAADSTSFIDPLIAVSHDITFSRLPTAGRLLLHALAAPISLIGAHRTLQAEDGIEVAVRWCKASVTPRTQTGTEALDLPDSGVRDRDAPSHPK